MVSGIPAGDGKNVNLFYSVLVAIRGLSKCSELCEEDSFAVANYVLHTEKKVSDFPVPPQPGGAGKLSFQLSHKSKIQLLVQPLGRGFPHPAVVFLLPAAA